jgi:hypothetical protein
MRTGNDLGRLIYEALVTPNECDRNGEPANPTDGLFAIARSIGRLADAVEDLVESKRDYA